MNAQPLDRERIEKLCIAFMLAIRANYLQGPISRDRVLEALNALAICTANVIEGAADPQGEPLEFFMKALNQSLHDGTIQQG